MTRQPAASNPPAGAGGYESHPELDAAIETALALGLPLLVTGDPGCGKTALADHIAATYVSGMEGGQADTIRFNTKSQMTYGDLFYRYDTMRRFHQGQEAFWKQADVPKPVQYISYHGLGEAIIQSAEPGTYRSLLPPGYVHTVQKRHVVLIDEIDKAPRDVPNDLLAEIENLSFRIPELDNAEVRADERFRPVLVLTSNSEKALPDAFLRRCIFYHLPFPERDTLERIVARRLGPGSGSGRDMTVSGTDPLARDAIAVTRHLKENGRLRKDPGTAELLGFLMALRRAGFRPDQALRDMKRDMKKEDVRDWRHYAAVTLLKTRDDQLDARKHLDGIDWSLGEPAPAGT